MNVIFMIRLALAPVKYTQGHINNVSLFSASGPGFIKLKITLKKFFKFFFLKKIVHEFVILHDVGNISKYPKVFPKQSKTYQKRSW